MNEHALKAARALQTKYWLGVHAAEEELTNVAEIITRTALEPATKELREALEACVSAWDNDGSDEPSEGAYAWAARQAHVVLAKYPAKEQR